MRQSLLFQQTNLPASGDLAIPGAANGNGNGGTRNGHADGAAASMDRCSNRSSRNASSSW